MLSKIVLLCLGAVVLFAFSDARPAGDNGSGNGGGVSGNLHAGGDGGSAGGDAHVHHTGSEHHHHHHHHHEESPHITYHTHHFGGPHQEHEHHHGGHDEGGNGGGGGAHIHHHGGHGGSGGGNGAKGGGKDLESLLEGGLKGGSGGSGKGLESLLEGGAGNLEGGLKGAGGDLEGALTGGGGGNGGGNGGSGFQFPLLPGGQSHSVDDPDNVNGEHNPYDLLGSGLNEQELQRVEKILKENGNPVGDLDTGMLKKLAGHKYGHLGVDSTQPEDCKDEYYFNDGVLKHFVRGARDAGDAFLSGLNTIIGDVVGVLPPLQNLDDGLERGLQQLVCGAENAFSDFADDFDSATHIAKNGLIDIFKGEGPGIFAFPEGIAGIAGKAGEAIGSAFNDGADAINQGFDTLEEHFQK